MIGRSLLCLALAFAAATPALAEHHQGGPLNPDWSNKWVSIGRFSWKDNRADGYVDMRRDLWTNRRAIVAHFYLVFDQPRRDDPRGPIAEEELVYEVDCTDKLTDHRPIDTGYGLDGHTLYADYPSDNVNYLGPVVSGTADERVFNAVCGQRPEFDEQTLPLHFECLAKVSNSRFG